MAQIARRQLRLLGQSETGDQGVAQVPRAAMLARVGHQAISFPLKGVAARTTSAQGTRIAWNTREISAHGLIT